MAAIWHQLTEGFRTGAWLTPARRRGYALILIAIYGLATLVWVVTSDGMIDRNGKPLGTDFSNVYAAGILAQRGEADVAYDWAREHATEKEIFGRDDVPFYGWHYPPLFLMAAAVLALLPYGWALFAWMAATLPAYVATMRAIVPMPGTVLAALSFPAVFVNLGHGQNGFLSTALIGGALLLIDVRPILAGVLIGLFAYKPQFGVLIPLVLLVTGRWTVIASAAATVLAACAATFALFGSKVWIAFAASTEITRRIVLEAGGTGWEKIQSLFSAVRMWGGGIEAAYAAQLALTLAVAASLVWLWRSSATHELKAAALSLGTLLATPYVLDYDLVMLAVAIAFFVRHGLAHGFRDFEISLLALAWFAPLIARAFAQVTCIPLGLMVQIVLYVLILHRAACDVATPHRSECLVQA